MSTIATATVLPTTALPQLREAAVPRKSFLGKARDHFPDVLARHGRKVGSYNWSGYVLATLLPFLEERRGVRLMQSEFDDLANYLAEVRGASYFFLTQEHHKWLADLDPATFDEQELEKYYSAFTETAGTGSGKPMLAGVGFLRDVLTALDASEVGLVSIG